jgi:hypothetical protein
MHTGSKHLLPRPPADVHGPSPSPRPQPLLQATGLYAALRDLEMPLVRVLAAMEAAGVTVDVQVLQTQEQPLQKRIQQLKQQVGRWLQGLELVPGLKPG